MIIGSFFFAEPQLAYDTLKSAGADLKDEEFEKEAWTDIMLDNTDPLNRQYFAVYAEGEVTTDSDCIYIEVEPTEKILEQVISILPE